MDRPLISVEMTVDDRIHTGNAYGSATGALPAEPAPISRDPFAGVIQGLASIALGMTFVIGGPATMFLIWVLWDSHFRGFTRLDIVLIAICGFGGCLIILTSAVFGLIFGISSIMAARRQNSPASLGITGVLLTGFSIVMWLFITILWAFAIGSRI